MGAMSELRQRREQYEDRRDALVGRMHDLMNRGGRWRSSHQDRFDRLASQVEELDKRIRQAAVVERVLGEANEHAPLFAKHLRGGVMTEPERQLFNTLSTTTGSQGGHTVPSLVAAEVLSREAQFAAVREVARIHETPTGADLAWPTSDGTAEVGEMLAQNAPATAQDPAFGAAVFKAFTFSSKVIVAPMELVQDATADLEGFLAERAAERIGRAANPKFTTGTGSGEPQGVVTGSAEGKVGAGVATVTYDELVDLEQSVDPSYRRRGTWMFGDAILTLLKKLKDDANRPIWLPGLGELAPATINGRPYIVNPDMPAPGADNKSILFGDFSRFVVRDVMQVTMMRLADSKYLEKHQVGFLAFARHDSRILDSTAIKHFVHAAA